MLIHKLINASQKSESLEDSAIEKEICALKLHEAVQFCSERLPRCYSCGFRGLQLRRCDTCAMVEYCSEDCQRHHT